MDLSLTEVERDQRRKELLELLVKKAERKSLPGEYVHLGINALIESEHDDQQMMEVYVNRMIALEEQKGEKVEANAAHERWQAQKALPMIGWSATVEAECMATPSRAIGEWWPGIEAVG